jgi:predicted HAD superfamily Cof-like phosphohydrolase
MLDERALEGTLSFDSPTVSVGVEDLRNLLTERAHLRGQVAELQVSATRRQESALGRTVRAFMLRIGHVVRARPTVPPEAEVRLRLRLVAEEFFELLDAASPTSSEVLFRARKMVGTHIDEAPVEVNMAELVDALADIDYVVEGTRAAFGVEGAAVAAEVHRSNMAKLDGGRLREDGKFLKPAGWTPPDIRGVLITQGWER